MDDVILHKLLTLEVIVETIMDMLIENELIDADTFDDNLIVKIKELDRISNKSEDKFDYSPFLMGPKGEA
jgi:hypothetical protein